jgi:hypothetical protein
MSSFDERRTQLFEDFFKEHGRGPYVDEEQVLFDRAAEPVKGRLTELLERLFS